MMDEAPVSSDARRDLRAVVDEVREELGHRDQIKSVGDQVNRVGDRVDRVGEKLDSVGREVAGLRTEVQALVKVGESLAIVGAWAMKWTPYIIGALYGANLLDLRALIAALVTRAAP